MNARLQFADATAQSAPRTRASRTNGSLPAHRINTLDPISIDVADIRRATQRNGEGQPTAILAPALPSKRELKLESAPAPAGNARRLAFRCVRLAVSGALLSSVAFYTHEVVDQAVSEQAYINGEITALRAPINGQLQLAILAGRALPSGTTLFTIENTRFGNQEVASQFNWVTESAERLQAESDEAAVRFKQQEEVYRINQRLFDEQVLSRLALLEEETELKVAHAAMTNKQILAAQARDRSLGVKRQVELQRAATVKMPFDGVAWAVPAKNGAEVSTHETVVEVLDPRRIWVDAFFPEKYAGKIAVGASAASANVR